MFGSGMGGGRGGPPGGGWGGGMRPDRPMPQHNPQDRMRMQRMPFPGGLEAALQNMQGGQGMPQGGPMSQMGMPFSGGDPASTMMPQGMLQRFGNAPPDVQQRMQMMTQRRQQMMRGMPQGVPQMAGGLRGKRFA